MIYLITGFIVGALLIGIGIRIGEVRVVRSAGRQLTAMSQQLMESDPSYGLKPVTSDDRRVKERRAGAELTRMSVDRRVAERRGL